MFVSPNLSHPLWAADDPSMRQQSPERWFCSHDPCTFLPPHSVLEHSSAGAKLLGWGTLSRDPWDYVRGFLESGGAELEEMSVGGVVTGFEL